MQSRGIEKFVNKTLAGLTILYLMTELLGSFNILNRRMVIVSWVLVLGLVFVLRKKQSGRKMRISVLKAVFSKPKGVEMTALFLLILLVVTLGIMAVLTPPYNWDSHTYHLTRIAHWIQDGSVDYFVTNNRRQLISPVLAEYVLLHLFLMTGSDLCANLLQYTAFLVCVAVAVHIMKRFHVSNIICILSVFLFATSPLAIGESLSTQVDFFAAMCLFLAADKIVVFEENFLSDNCVMDKNFYAGLIRMSLSVALCYLAKPNICLSLALLLFWLFIRCIQRKTCWRRIMICVLTGAAIVILLPMPVFIRNIRYCGDPFGAAYMTGISVGSLSPGVLFLNAYKNIATLGVMQGNREYLLAFAKKLSGILNLDLNDPRITFGNGRHLFDANLIFSYDHDYAQAGLYVLIFAIVILLYLLAYPAFRRSGNRNGKKTNGYVAVLILQFVVSLCLIRWQPWVCRLLLPALSLTVIPFAVMLNEIVKHWAETAVGFALLLVIAYYGIQPVAYHMNYVKKSVSRDYTRWELYFAKRPLSDIYEELLAYAYGIENVGIYAQSDAYEYPLWVKLKENSGGRCHIENIVAGEEIDDFLPGCIIVLDQICTEYEYHGKVYRAVFVEPAHGMYSVLY